MKLFKFKSFLRNRSIDSICKKWKIENYTINEDGSIDLKGTVHLFRNKLTKLPLKFRNIIKCPQKELNPLLNDGDFYCGDNKLTSLEGSPISVGGGFYCNNNKLTNLIGSPKEVGGVFSCEKNQLTSLLGSPKSVGGGFYCYDNGLTSLEGITQIRSGDIICYDNNLRDVKGIKEGWRGRLAINNNPVYEIFKLFPKERFDEVVEYLNEYDVIRDGKVVVLQALEQVYYEMDLDLPEIEYIEGYEII